jgi:tetratricopeptide (TPR) repeat protein
MALISKGQTGAAANLLEELVRDAPNDWRARGRLAELYLKTDNAQKAEVHFRHVGGAMMKDGQYKPAIAIYKQLVKLAPTDGEIIGRLGECQHQSRFLNEAKKCYNDAIALLAQSKPERAAHYAQKLLELAPDETSVRVRYAELLEGAGMRTSATKEWTTLAAQATARGRPNDRARFLEKVLQAAPNDFETLVGAAESRIAMGDAKAAFPHLQKAHAQSKDPVRVMELLARAFEAVGQAPKARQVWLECAKAAAKAGSVATQKKALEAALRIQPDDDATQDELASLGGPRIQRDLALSKQPWAAATNEEEARALTKAEVEARYGFPDRAISTLESVPKSVPIAIALAERRAAEQQFDGALEALDGISVDDPQARRLLETQRKQLAKMVGEPEPESTDDPMSLEESGLEPLEEDLDASELSPMDETIEHAALEDLEPITEVSHAPAKEATGPEADADRFAAEGRTSEAMALYRKALEGDPANERVLMKIGELLSGDPRRAPETRTALVTEPPGQPTPPNAGTAPKALPPSAPIAKAIPAAAKPVEAPRPKASPIPDAAPPARQDADVEMSFDEEPSGSQLEELSDNELRVLQARAWMAVFQYKDAIDAVHGVNGLAAIVVRSDAKRFVSQASEACASLQLALAEASENDPAYREALWVLSSCYLAVGKPKPAKRLLLELEELDPRYRADDVANRLRGLGMLERLK